MMDEPPSLSPFGHGYGGLEEHRVPRPVTRPPQRVGVPAAESPQAGGIRGKPWTCPEDAVKCVVEEWYI